MERKIFCNGKLMLTLKGSTLQPEDLMEIFERTGLSRDEYYLLHRGKKLEQGETITCDVACVLRLLGGKGGFGSMLRAIGAQIEKTTNREACRDLSGRRLRDINEEKRLKAWLEKQKDRESEAEEKRRKKLEKLIAVPKHEFKDSEYESARSELSEKVSEAVEEGFKKASLKPIDPISIKRKANDNGTSTAKKVALWIDDNLGSSSEDTDLDTDPEEGSSGSMKCGKLSEKVPCKEENKKEVESDSSIPDSKLEIENQKSEIVNSDSDSNSRTGSEGRRDENSGGPTASPTQSV